ncbi:DUF4097 family beta strand repeat-containing protein [Streptomyces sp. TLI_146]|uniref:DUF4097 family beta strand repeat-containing protein n=1 Tax=Streptomyces sp. TLI_146 TaxID=1938858 RepID=UPI000C711F5C|nr:DUF4097 family beta strand repeat-containing protein [Streptomyces sp. TLI_146]PKV83860.1 DUF4097 and DUF4098 domain-containing protein YvlB [Streptomyces sp. TLI_146]
MPRFDTPQPISVILEFDIGSARISAGKRTDTVVEVLPRDGAAETDVRTAQQTQVTYSGGKLVVKGPKRSLFSRSGSLDISIELPAGSRLQGTAPLGDFVTEGLLGDCALKTSAGDIQVEHAAAAHLKTGHGDIRLGSANGDVDVAGSGRVEIGEVAGTATVKNVNGETTIGEVTGDVRANASNGRISLGVAHAGVDAKSANGAIRIADVRRGQVVLMTAMGDLEVGIRESTAAWLDVNTRMGIVRNSLSTADGPGAEDHTVEVRARTGLGDIVIRRA